MSKVFFNDADEFASMFTPKNRVRLMNPKGFCVDCVDKEDKEEFPGCMKSIEFFENDIVGNLKEWAYVGGDNAIFYRTRKYWYFVRLGNKLPNKGLILITRFRNGTWNRIDDWCNKSSWVLGKVWLMTPDQKDKRIPLFHS